MHRHSAPANPLIQRALQGDAKPGGNITGFTDYDPPMAGKWLGMLTQIIPPVARVAVLFNPATRALCRSDGTRHRGIDPILSRAGAGRAVSRRCRDRGDDGRDRFLRQPSRLLRAEIGRSCRWRNGSDDFVSVRGHLDCQKAAFSVAHDIESYAHVLRKYLGVIAGFFLGHEAVLLAPSNWRVFLPNGLERRPVPTRATTRFLPRVTTSKAAAISASWWSL